MNDRLQNFIDINRDRTILKYYLVPLCGIEPTLIGHNRNVGTVLMNKEGTEIYVSLKKYTRAMGSIKDAPSYKYFVELNKIIFYVFDVPLEYREDIQKIISGDYTSINRDTKKYICKASGLPYNKKSGTFSNSSTVLQALYSDSPLKKVLAEYLDVKVTELPQEMISKIPSDSSVFVENFIKKEGA